MIKTKLALAAVVASCLFACKKTENSTNVFNTLVSIDTVTAGVQCSNGGLLIKTGLDLNRNSKLDASEVTESRYLCNGESNKQVIIPLGPGYANGELGYVTNINASIPAFDINNYPGVDSIVVYASPYGRKPSIDSPRVFSTTVEIVNLSTGEVIAGSSIHSTAETENAVYISSGNIYANFPKTKFNLGIKLTSGFVGDYAYTHGDVYLMLYRK